MRLVVYRHHLINCSKTRSALTNDRHLLEHDLGVEGGCICGGLTPVLARVGRHHRGQEHMARIGPSELQIM